MGNPVSCSVGLINAPSSGRHRLIMSRTYRPMHSKTMVIQPEPQRSLVLAVSQRTNLNIKFSVDCLESNGWDLEKAVANFEAVKVRFTSCFLRLSSFFVPPCIILPRSFLLFSLPRFIYRLSDLSIMFRSLLHPSITVMTLLDFSVSNGMKGSTRILLTYFPSLDTARFQ